MLCSLHPPIRRHGDRLLAGEIRPGDRAAAAWRLAAGVPRATICAAVAAGAGAEVEQLVGAGDHLAVVLDDQQRVAQVAELLQRVEQPAVVARVQADRRLVEHVEHAAQAAADLGWPGGCAASRRRRASGRAGRASGSPARRRPGTAAGCGSRGSARRRSSARRASSFQLWNSSQQLAQRQAAELVDRPAAEAARPRRRRAAGCRRRREHSTSSTRCSSSPRKPGDSAAGFFQRRIEALVLEAEERWPRPPDRTAGFRRAACRAVHVEPLLARAVQDQPAVAARRVRSNGTSSGNARARAQSASSIGANSRLSASGHRPTRPLGERELRIAQQRGRVRAGLRAQSFAGRAPAQRAVEREVVRRERLEAPAAAVAGEVLAVRSRPATAARARRRADRPRAARRCPATGRFRRCRRCASGRRAGPSTRSITTSTVVLAAAVDRRAARRASTSGRRRERGRSPAPAVSSHSVSYCSPTWISSGAIRYSFVPAGWAMILAMISSADWRADRHVAGRAVRLAEPGHEDPQVVVDLGDRADRAARRVARVLLLDGDGRREALDVVDLAASASGRRTAGRRR